MFYKYSPSDLKRLSLIFRRETYARLLAEGYSSAAAARAIGVHKRTARTWRNGRCRANGKHELPSYPFYNTGMVNANTEIGIKSNTDRKLDPKFLTFEERVKIDLLLKQGKKERAIARELGRHHSIINREIKRNADEYGNYSASLAQYLFHKRLARPKETKIDQNPGLWLFILNKLRNYWSPMQISKHLSEHHKDDDSMNLSHESIYRAIYIQGKGRLKEELKKLLRHGHPYRKPRKGAVPSRFREPMINISERPAEANDRAIPGHWEGDLILGKSNRSAIGTLVERATRYCILLHLPKDHSAESVQNEVIRKMKLLPDHLKKTLAWDQGSELALHSRISKELDMQVFFCDPRSPWQRGSNENTNGLLRQYFPKGTDLSVHSDEHLDLVAESLNTRPRQTLGWKTPAQKFLEFQDLTLE
jgi:IS30 family transposase